MKEWCEEFATEENPASIFRVDWLQYDYPSQRLEAAARAQFLGSALQKAGDCLASLDDETSAYFVLNCKSVIGVLLWQPYLTLPEKVSLAESVKGLLEAAVVRGLPDSVIVMFWDDIQEGRGFWHREPEVEAILRKEMLSQRDISTSATLRQAAAIGLSGLDEALD